MRTITNILLYAVVLLSASGTLSQTQTSSLFTGQQSHAVAELHLVPQPGHIEIAGAPFRVSTSTRIFISAAHAKEDRTAADMLGQEIVARGHRKLRVQAVPGLSSAPGIYLLREGDRGAQHALTTMRASRIPAEKDNRELHLQSYYLHADAQRILVIAPAGQGLFYGVQTLRQLLRTQGEELICPGVTIHDSPAMQWRGVHVDISRGPIPTLEYMKKQIRRLSEYKINLYALYMENVFEYQQHPLIAPPDALTSAEVKELVTYASEYYITLVPEQQSFGHLHNVLRNELYTGMAETPHGHVLAPDDPDSYKLILSFYSELAPLFPGPFFHIGSDETFELGTGKSKARAEQEGLGRVYLEHLQRIYELMKPYHKRLMFWGDIAVKYPQLLGILPKDMIAVPWNYDVAPNYDNLIKPFRDAGMEVFVSPGVDNWNKIFPNLDDAYVNIRNFTRDGQKYSSPGQLNTIWNDDGESLLDISWPALLFGAACGWQSGESSIPDFQSAYDWAFYRNSEQSFNLIIKNLQAANSALTHVGLGSARNEAFWTNPFTPSGVAYAQKAMPAAHELRLAAENALVSLSRSGERAHANTDTLTVLTLAAKRLDLLGMKIQYTREINRFYWDAFQNQKEENRVEQDLEEIAEIDGRLQDLRDATTELRSLYSAAWKEEYRPYWLDNVLIRYENLAGVFQREINEVLAARRQYYDSHTLPAPEQLGFYWKQ